MSIDSLEVDNISINNDSSEDDDEYEKEEDKDLIKIKLEKEIIQIKFSQLCKYSHLIRTKYLISDVRNKLSYDIQEFQKQYKIREENVSLFFQLLREEKIKITQSTYSDLFKLSQFFITNKILKKLKKYSEKHFDAIETRIQFLLNEVEISKINEIDNYKFELAVQMEEYLIENIDKCFENSNFKKKR